MQHADCCHDHPNVNDDALVTMLSTDPTIASKVTRNAKTLTEYNTALVNMLGLYSLIHISSGKYTVIGHCGEAGCGLQAMIWREATPNVQNPLRPCGVMDRVSRRGGGAHVATYTRDVNEVKKGNRAPMIANTATTRLRQMILITRGCSRGNRRSMGRSTMMRNGSRYRL